MEILNKLLNKAFQDKEIKDDRVTHKAGYTICHDTEDYAIYNLLVYAYNKKIYKIDFIRVSSVLFLIKDEKKEVYKFLLKNKPL